MYFTRTPFLLKKMYPGITWDLPNKEHKVFITFDDGPHPEITPWVLDQLKDHHAKATFFCLGRNAEKYPELVERIIEEGHAIGNHSYSHLNGWKATDESYLKDIQKADKIFIGIKSKILKPCPSGRREAQDDGKKLFRPPYGRIKRSQVSVLASPFKIYNWSIMPGDFDDTITSEKCFLNLSRIKIGDIICLHDNEKAWKHLHYCLPKWLEDLKHYKLERIS